MANTASSICGRAGPGSDQQERINGIERRLSALAHHDWFRHGAVHTPRMCRDRCGDLAAIETQVDLAGQCPVAGDPGRRHRTPRSSQVIRAPGAVTHRSLATTLPPQHPSSMLSVSRASSTMAVRDHLSPSA